MRISSIILIIFVIYSCQSKKESNKTELNSKKDYVLKEDGGIFVELFDSTNVDPNRYTENNFIYIEDTEFIYSFEHIDPNGNKYFIKNEDKSLKGKSEWTFVSSDSIDESTIQKVKISVKYGLEPMIKYIPDYNQTILKYQYPTNDNKNAGNYSTSGAIENEKNVWIHPPRDSYFEILELNPFPFARRPYEIGNKWTWQLTIGDVWADERWKIWEGQIENIYEYEIVNKTILETVVGDLECFS